MIGTEQEGRLLKDAAGDGHMYAFSKAYNTKKVGLTAAEYIMNDHKSQMTKTAES